MKVEDGRRFQFGDDVEAVVHQVEEDGTLIMSVDLELVDGDDATSFSGPRKWKRGESSQWWSNPWYWGQWDQSSSSYGQWYWKQEDEWNCSGWSAGQGRKER